MLLDLPTEEVEQPWDHFAEQREITDVVDVELQRLRRQLSELGLVCVLYSCQTEAQILAGTVGAEPEQSWFLPSPMATICTPAAFSWAAAATASS